MIGIIIDLGPEMQGSFYKINNRPAIEYVISSALKCDLAHSVSVALPPSYKYSAHGSITKEPLFNANIEYDGKGIYCIYSKSENNEIDRLYRTAVVQHIDTIIHIKSDNIFIPTWFINNIILEYMSNSKNCYFGTNIYSSLDNNNIFNCGFYISVFPFWMLARAHIWNDSFSSIKDFCLQNCKYELYDNIEDNENYIFNPSQELTLTKPDQLPVFEEILHEISIGTDISSVLMAAFNE